MVLICSIELGPGNQEVQQDLESRNENLPVDTDHEVTDVVANGVSANYHRQVTEILQENSLHHDVSILGDVHLSILEDPHIDDAIDSTVQKPCIPPKREKKNREEGIPRAKDHNYHTPRAALAMIEVDEWEIHPINIFLGKMIGQGYWGKVHRSLVKSNAVRKLKDIISDSLKHQHVFAAVKILKGWLTLSIPFYPVFRCMHLYTKQPIFVIC